MTDAPDPRRLARGGHAPIKRTGAAVAVVVLLTLVAVLLFVSARRPLVDAAQPLRGDLPAAVLEPGRPLGQTFVAHHAGLSGIDLYLQPSNTQPLTLTLHLRLSPVDGTDLATSVHPLAATGAAGMVRFSFPPLGDSHGRTYYAEVETSAPGVAVPLAVGSAYRDGAAHVGGEPLDAQATFQLLYRPAYAGWGLLRSAVGWLGLVAVAGLVFMVPGWALLDGLRQQRGLTWAETLGLSGGMGLAAIAVLVLWTDALGLHLGAGYAWLPAGAGLAVLAWRHRTARPARVWSTVRAWVRSEAAWPDLALVLALALVFGVRLLVVNTLDAPLWGDSVHHAAMAQLMVDQGGLANSWQPYAPFDSFTMHFGFPLASALLSWTLGFGNAQATLIAGQLLNGLAILSLYPLAVRLADGRRWAGVAAVVAGGLLSPMPAYYVNWGRYAQLAGQAILPVALWLVCEVLDREPPINLRGRGALPELRAVGLGGLAAAGMALGYYRMPFYYAVFILAWLATRLPQWRLHARPWLVGLARLGLTAACAGLLLVPLGFRLRGGALASRLASGVAAGSGPDWAQLAAEYRVWQEIAFYVPPGLLAAALVGLAWGLGRKGKHRPSVAAVGLWVAGLSSLVAGQIIRLPGANMMQNFAILIALYIPVALLVGWLAAELAGDPGSGSRLGRARQIAVGSVLLLLAFWGALGQMRIVRPENIMVTRPDMQAMEWIRNNTPPEARFLVEGFRIYGGITAVGSDAGWWIPLLTGRQNTMPPQYTLLPEVPSEAGYSQRVVDLVAGLEAHRPGSAEGLALLCESGITHVYVGQTQGTTGGDAAQLFSPGDLDASPAFRAVYQGDRVGIWALDRNVCKSEP